MAERKVISEVIELYKNLPCLWDVTSEEYRDVKQKKLGWNILVKAWKKIYPDANVATVKKKIENLRASYKREEKKIKNSKKRSGSVHEIHIPNLWYFHQMSFIGKENKKKKTGVDTLSSNANSLKVHQVGENRRPSDLLETKKHKIIETAQDPLGSNPGKCNSFAIYVGEQMDTLPTYQRQIAEKLISDVIFLAKTESLNLNTRVETQTRQHPTFHGHSLQRFPSPQSSSPSYASLPSFSPQIIVKTESSLQYDSSGSSTSSLQIYDDQSPEAITSDFLEPPTGSLLKELLMSKNWKD